MTLTLPLEHATLLFTCTGLLCFAALVGILACRPNIGVALCMAAEAWDLLADGVTPSIQAAGVQLHLRDMLVTAAVLAALGQLAAGPRPRWTAGPAAFAVLLLLTLISLLHGMVAFGVQAAGNEARGEFLHVLGVAGYVAVIRPGKHLLPAIIRIWACLTVVFLVQALLGWSQFGINSASSEVLSGGKMIGGRPVAAASALFIAQTAMMLLCLRWHERRHRWIAGILLSVTVLLQHRTIWVSVIAMVGAWILLRPGRAGRKAAHLALLAGMAVAALLALFLTPDQSVTESLTESASDDSTMKWRMDGWAQFLAHLHGVRDWLFGLPFGSGFTRLGVNGAPVPVSPHGYYVQLIMRIGLVGLVVLGVLVVRSLHATDRSTATGRLLWVLVLGELCYWLPYSPALPDGLLIGLLLRGVMGERHSVAHRVCDLSHERVKPDKQDIDRVMV